MSAHRNSIIPPARRSRPDDHQRRHEAADPRKLFVNIPVNDVQRSIDLLREARLHLQPAVHRRNGDLHARRRGRLLHAARPSRSSRRSPSASRRPAQADRGLFALIVDSRAEVDEMVKKALAAGGKHAMPSRRITASCTAGASTISTATTGKCSGWIRARCRGDAPDRST